MPNGMGVWDYEESLPHTLGGRFIRPTGRYRLFHQTGYEIRSSSSSNCSKRWAEDGLCHRAFVWLVIPFGLTNALATLMNQVFHEYLDKFVVVYLDDIVVFSSIVEDHLDKTTWITWGRCFGNWDNTICLWSRRDALSHKEKWAALSEWTRRKSKLLVIGKHQRAFRN